MPLAPLIPYVGGKRRLASQIVDRFPEVVENYVEPFVGSGAVYGEYITRPTTTVVSAHLFDGNADVVAFHKTVRDFPDDLADALDFYSDAYERSSPHQRERLYYGLREAWNAGARGAALFCFLKHAAFNGLWRENAGGGMNAAFGKYGSGRLLPEVDDVYRWSDVLDGVTIECSDWNAPSLGWLELEAALGRDDLVYSDSPYAGTFTSYVASGFHMGAQAQLLAQVREWRARGVSVAYSNSLAVAGLVVLFWPEAQHHYLTTRYMVSGLSSGRPSVVELLCTEVPRE